MSWGYMLGETILQFWVRRGAWPNGRTASYSVLYALSMPAQCTFNGKL